MPILTLQQRMRELGRIRIGAKDPKKGFPVKLTSFRFTSRDKHAIDSAAKLYGGTVIECNGQQTPDLKGQWEVTTDASEIPFYPSPIPPSQNMELWSGGGCQRRCDGCTELLTGDPCMCDPEAVECKPTTRLSVILPDLPDIGTWRIESHGWNAAAELVQTFEWLKGMIGSGQVIEGVLGVEERTGKHEGKTTRFMVPVIRIKQTPRELLAAQNAQALGQSVPALGSSAPALPPSHETAEHQLKDPNPRGAVFAMLADMKLPPHENEAKALYYQVFSQVLRRDVSTLSEVTEPEWQTLCAWLHKVKDGLKTEPPVFDQWRKGTHPAQLYDPTESAGDTSQPELVS